MNIYLDIDGVLITKTIRPAEGVTEFLKHMTENHDCYWLTTHCKDGQCHAKRYVEGVLPKEAMQYVRKIKPTDWQTYKTEAIDFSKDFRWFDDTLMSKEKEVLKKNEALDKFVRVKDEDLSQFI